MENPDLKITKVVSIKISSFYLLSLFISSLHAITTHDITVIQEPRISKLEGTSDQMIRPATIAPGTERYLMGAKTTASPNLNA